MRVSEKWKERQEIGERRKGKAVSRWKADGEWKVEE